MKELGIHIKKDWKKITFCIACFICAILITWFCVKLNVMRNGLINLLCFMASVLISFFGFYQIIEFDPAIYDTEDDFDEDDEYEEIESNVIFIKDYINKV